MKLRVETVRYPDEDDVFATFHDAAMEGVTGYIGVLHFKTAQWNAFMEMLLLRIGPVEIEIVDHPPRTSHKKAPQPGFTI